MNNKQCVTFSCRVNVCKVREEVDFDLGQFVRVLFDDGSRYCGLNP